MLKQYSQILVPNTLRDTLLSSMKTNHYEIRDLEDIKVTMQNSLSLTDGYLTETEFKSLVGKYAYNFI